MKVVRKRKLFILSLIAIIVMIGIGYAYLTSNLNINGTSSINNARWDIHLENVVVNENSVSIGEGDSAATINPNDNTEVTYSISLDKPGDFYEFTVDVKNYGTIDGMIESITSTFKIDDEDPIVIAEDNSNLPVYLDYSITYSNGDAIEENHELKVGEKETYKVRIEFKKNITVDQLPTRTQTIDFSMRSILTQANSTTSPTEGSIVQYPVGKTKDTVEVGDVVSIGTEEFYVVKHDGEDLVLLAHYNLNVGNNKKLDATEGIQNSEVRGFLQSGIKYGIIYKFSNTSYWNGKVGGQYPGSYCTNSNETNCVYVYDSNSVLFQYVEDYKSYLEGLGAVIKTARLMSLEEAYYFKNMNQYAWKETSYWLGTAARYDFIWIVNSAGSLNYADYDGWSGNEFYGVRPVIII